MNIAIIPAAGSGSRIGGSVQKQFIEIAGAPILIHTIRKFDACPEIDAICIALPPERLADFGLAERRFSLHKPLQCVKGGRERSESISNALEAIANLRPEIVAVHDAVRPFVTLEQISAVVQRARAVGAAILALPATDTIKEVEDGLITRTLDRRRIYRAQTPQAFRYELLCRANSEAIAAGISPATLTDDAMLVERLGVPIAVVEGSVDNLKITTPEDLLLAARLFDPAGHAS
jgi:2-C-methyl-D-erythritol 4-phosphate cytidylyltransferase